MEPNISSFQDLVFNFHQTVLPLDVKLIYEGEINHEIIKVFTKLTEKNLKNEEFQGQKKVFNVMVECLQNICHHSTPIKGIKEENTGKGMFLISNSPDELTIVTGNIIDCLKQTKLSAKIDHINTLSKESLRAYYIEMLKESKISDTGGAGLGFIDIARKTKNKLSYKFHPINKDFSFFILSAKISK